MIAMLHETLHALVTLPAEMPTPGDPVAPPGMDEKFTVLMNWVKYLSFGVLIMALMAAGAMLGFGGRDTDGTQHAGRVGKVLIGAMIVSAAGVLISFVAT